jgi:N6-L-threonylcarbamoyladenine synthase
MILLGIESSCDDLSMAILQDGTILSNVTASQVADHRPFGGVVPEIASRKHLEALEPTLELALARGGVSPDQLEGIAVTYAPGLVGSLLVGLNFAKGLAFGWNIPFRGVHHIEGHLWSPFLENEVRLPFLGLVVSGGHTHLYQVEELGRYRLLGQTVDDAAGEAFDKVAKAMGLPYPGGPAIDELSQKGNPDAYPFSLPRVKTSPFHTSFSGMKTAAMEVLRQLPAGKEADLAASFQKGVVHALCTMVQRALGEVKPRQLVVAGGVACNRALRQAMMALAETQGIELLLPSPKYCTDNGAMIAWVGWQYLRKGFPSDFSLNAQARCPLGQAV